MMPRALERVLIVEGQEEMRVLPYFMEANGIPWPKGNEPICIKEYGGYENIISDGALSAEFKSPALRAIGIIVDADSQLDQRWNRLRNLCMAQFPKIPDVLDPNGLILDNDDGLRLGIWIMPDNQSTGMLETFLAYCLNSSIARDLWDYARTCCTDAKTKGAGYRSCHFDKASIHCWLSWQNTPGAQLHHAVFKGLIDPSNPGSSRFVNWFRDVFMQ